MKTIKSAIAVLALSIFMFSCNKDDEKLVPQSDCTAKNYGVITISYTKLTERHAIDISKVDDLTFFKSKISRLTFAKDTVHLKPGNYKINISRINQTNQSIENYPLVNATVTQCDELFINTQI